GNVLAVQSERGTWFRPSVVIGPFTPRTWVLAEALTWSGLLLGITSTLFGLASLVRWIRSSGQSRIAALNAFEAARRSYPTPTTVGSTLTPPPPPPLEVPVRKSLDAGATVARQSRKVRIYFLKDKF